MLSINLNNLKFSYNSKPILIAEIGINHQGSLSTAKLMARLAAESGADIIKHQTHFVEDEMSIEAKKIKVFKNNSIYSIIKECALSKEEEVELKNYVENDLRSNYLSTPFSRTAANFLNEINLPFFKIGSGECNNFPFLEHVAKFNKPIILSTGMNNISNIEKAVEILKNKKIPFILLHTTNSYPCPDSAIRLGCILDMKNHFNGEYLIGYSDHSVGQIAVHGAVALGACVIEKHFTDDLNRDGPDIECSMDPKMCYEISMNIERLFNMRSREKNLHDIEKNVAKFAFASVVAIEDIKLGELFTEDNIWVRRPGNGDFSAEDFKSILGSRARSNISKNTQIKIKDVKKN